MKTKFMCMILMLAFALNLSACGNSKENMNSSENGISIDMTQSEKDKALENIGNESSDNNTNNTKVGTVNDSAFSGKIKGCYYADDNKIIVKMHFIRLLLQQISSIFMIRKRARI